MCLKPGAKFKLVGKGSDEEIKSQFNRKKEKFKNKLISIEFFCLFYLKCILFFLVQEIHGEKTRQEIKISFPFLMK